MMTDGQSPTDGSKGPAQKHRLDQSAEDQLQYFTEQRRRAARPMKKTRESPPGPDRSEAGEKE